MVGDDVESDVGGALSAGLSGVLVRTGKYRGRRWKSRGSGRPQRSTRSPTSPICSSFRAGPEGVGLRLARG